MNRVIEAMLDRYKPQNNEERENAIKEIMQEIALAGLSPGGFFDKAAFYGETCLRIFHGLNRFSEDLDFALLEKNPSFQLETYFPALEKEFQSYGIDISIESKNKDEKKRHTKCFSQRKHTDAHDVLFPKKRRCKKNSVQSKDKDQV